MTFAFANILTAFDESTIGSKVGNPTAFLAALETAVATHDESRDRADFVLRNHRGNVNPFLRRDCALPVTFLATIVYTREAYLADPDVIASSETIADDATHVVVAVLASAEGVPNPLPRGTYRLAHCLAGGNKEADAWTLAEVKQMCTDSVAYEDTFCVVAD